MIGWYAHHLGAGHLSRATTVAALLATPVVILSSGTRPADWPPERWVQLPDDADATGEDVDAGGLLHWAPLGDSGYRRRMEVIARWVADERPTLVVSDVSVEVTLLVRLLAVPVVVTVMAGDRADRPHRAAYDAAAALVAAWPPEAGSSLVSGWERRWDAKTTFVGAFSRFDGVETLPPSAPRTVAVLWGAGGSEVEAGDLRAARDATPGWTWSLVAGLPRHEVWSHLQAAEVVVAHAGQNALAEVAATRRPAVVVAQDRPHDEQAHLVRGLARMGLVTGRDGWPAPQEWPALLETAVTGPPPTWSRWADGHGAQRYAAHLDSLVAQWS